MPIIFVSFNDEFVEKMKTHYPTYKLDVAQHKPSRRTYYVSPANSFGWMNGGIDLPLATEVMPDIDKKLQAFIKKYCNKKLYMERPYLPIGSSIIIDHDEQRSLVSAPTMLHPQNVAGTRNAYYASLAVLHNVFVNRKEDPNEVDLIFTSMCCGCGGMEVDESIKQTLQAFEDYKKYKPKCLKGEIKSKDGEITVNADIILNEPNLDEQPCFRVPTISFSKHNTDEEPHASEDGK